MIKKITTFVIILICLSGMFLFSEDNAQAAGFGNQIKQAMARNTIDSTDVLLKKISGKKNYPLTPGDIFTFTIALESATAAPSHSYSLILSSDYQLEIPYMGSINVKGKSYQETRQMVLKQLKAKMPINFVDFSLVSPGIFEVFLHGGVMAPGYISANALTTLMEGIQLVGGVLPGSSLRSIKLERNGELPKSIDLTHYLLKGNIEQNPLLMPGDKIFVPKADILCSIGGRIAFPDLYELIRGETLEDLIRISGGLSLDGVRSEIEVERIEADGTLNRYTVNYDKANEFPIENGDKVYIKSLSETEKMIMVQGALFGKPKETSGAVQAIPTTPVVVNKPYIKGTTLLQVLREFGGPTPFANAEKSVITRGLSQLKVNADQLWKTKNPELDMPLEPGDHIFIPMKKLTVNIGGNVVAPGVYPYEPGKTVAEYIALAGGLHPDTGSKNSIYLISESGKSQRIPFSQYITEPGVNLFAGRNGWESTTFAINRTEIIVNFVSVLIAVTTSGISLYKLING